MQNIGYALIVFIYANIAVFAVAGTISLTQKIFSPEKERLF